MEAGKLRHRVLFQVKTIPEPTDKLGNAQEDWTDDFTVWGAFEPLGSSLFPVIQRRYQETTARFRIRYRAGIDAKKHRIVYVQDPNASPVVTSTWDIFPPLPVDGRNIELHIEVSEIK